MAKKNPLIKKYGDKKQWVNYRKETRKGKTTKVPYAINGKKASSVDEKSWSTYEEARAASEQVGIVFTPAQTLLGIDIDHCLTGKKITHAEAETIAALIIEADTYTEISPSGEGLHLLLEIDEALALTGNKKAPFEIYTSGRYFTFTANEYGESKDVRKISKSEAEAILAIIGYPFVQESAIDNATSDTKPSHADTSNAKRGNVSDGSLSDEEVVSKMFKSKGGKKIEALYNGNIADYKDDASSADLALCSHFAFWTGKDYEQMERLWMASPLGSRKKTQERSDYRNRTLTAAIKSCKTVYETPQQKMDNVSPNLDLLYKLGAKGSVEYLQNTENMCRILRNHPDFKDTIRLDYFKGVIEIKEDGKWRAYEDGDDIAVQTQISILFSDWFGKVTKQMVYDAIVKVGKENKIDSAADYIKGIEWDGEARLDTWLCKTYGVTDDAYHKAVASNWLKGMVKRIIEPGCKFDFVLVLEGEQGSRKSTSLAVLGRDWHVETTMSTDNKDFFMQFQGKAIIEFSEGETMSRTEVKKMKAIITTQVDRYRVTYGRVSQDFPRRCVFAMTTNQSEYLKDETGNRRWLPVRVVFPEADVEWLEENRDQLFAEAYHRLYELKETTYEFPKEETLMQQQLRRISDPNEDIITEWYMTMVSEEEQHEGISIHRVYKEALHGNFTGGRSMNKYEEMSIATVLKDHLHLTKRQRMVAGVRVSLWCNETGVIIEKQGTTPMMRMAKSRDNF